MNASRLVLTLQEMIQKHGDIPVCIDDPDTGWALRPTVELGTVSGERFITITADYLDDEIIGSVEK